jgi:cobalt-zinc-cadmium efflux system outer membrane protein
VAIALWNNAALQADLAALKVARADLLDAGLLRNPTLQLLLPFGYTQFEMLLNLPGEILWQRPKRVAAAKIETDRVARGLEQNGLDLVRDVRCAYYDLQLARLPRASGQNPLFMRG